MGEHGAAGASVAEVCIEHFRLRRHSGPHCPVTLALRMGHGMISTKKVLELLKERDAAFAAERLNWTIERADLLNRIKPEAYQAIPTLGVVSHPARDMFDDDQYAPDYDTTNPATRALMAEAMESGVTE